MATKAIKAEMETDFTNFPWDRVVDTNFSKRDIPVRLHGYPAYEGCSVDETYASMSLKYSGSSTVIGSFQLELENAIDDWRCKSFARYLVKLKLTSCTDHDVDDQKRKNPSLWKAFSVALGDGYISTTAFVVFFKRHPQKLSNFLVKIGPGEKNYIDLQSWLINWLPEANSNPHLDLYAAGQNFVKDCMARKCFDKPTYFFLTFPVSIQLKIIEGMIKDDDDLRFTRPWESVSYLVHCPEDFEGESSMKAYIPPMKMDVITQSTVNYFIEGIVRNQMYRVGSTLKKNISYFITRSLVQNNMLEFDCIKSFRDFIQYAPLKVLCDVRNIRLCLCKDPGIRKPNKDRRANRLFTEIASTGEEQTPDWTLGALAYLPSLQNIEVYFPVRYDQYSHWFFHDIKPCRRHFSDTIVKALFPWITLPGVNVTFSGALRSSQVEHYDQMVKLAKKFHDANPVVKRFKLTDTIRDHIILAVTDNLARNRSNYGRAASRKSEAGTKAREYLNKLKHDFIFTQAATRYCMSGNSVIKYDVPKKAGWNKYLHFGVGYETLECKCDPPCFPDRGNNNKLVFFDDDEEGVKLNEEYQKEWVDPRAILDQQLDEIQERIDREFAESNAQYATQGASSGQD